MDSKDQYEFDADNSVAEQLSNAGKKLRALSKKASTGKDGLVKLLKQASAALEQASQSSDSQRRASGDVAAALVRKPVSDHQDKDVRTYTAICLAHVLRLHTADCPYSSEEQKGIFALFMWVFRRLETFNAPAFQMSQAVLDIVSQTKCCVLMWDLEGADDMVCDLFRVLLDVINDDNAEALRNSLLETMAGVIEEGDDATPQLLATILGGLLDASPHASRLAQRLLHRTEEQLRHHVQRFLIEEVSGESMDTDLKLEPADLLFKVYQACPQMLLTVWPHLMSQLSVNAEEQRLAAVEMLGRLFAIPGALLDSENPQLFAAYCRRFHDTMSTVRLVAIKQAGTMLQAVGGVSQEKLVAALVERLMDPEDDVRAASIEAVTTAAAHSLTLLGSLDPLTAVAGRLRDRKASVRQAAATRLLSVFHASCQEECPSVSADEESLAWIPGRLMLDAGADMASTTTLLAGAFKDGIFPAKLSNTAAARHWVVIYQALETPAERAGVRRLLKLHELLQEEVGRLLDLRSARAASDPSDQLEDSLQRCVRKVAAIAFADASKAEDALQKLLAMKDNNIFKGLRALCAPGTTREECKKLQKEVVQRVGSRGTTGTAVASLCRRLTPSLLAPEHVTELLDLAPQAQAQENEQYAGALLQLLDDAAVAEPRLFAKAGPGVEALVTADDPALAATGARILASAGAVMTAAGGKGDFPTDAVRMSLLDLCANGTVSAAKAAVRAVVALYGRQMAAKHLRQPIRGLANSLRAPTSPETADQLAAAVASITMAVRLLPEAFASQADDLGHFVLGELMEADARAASPAPVKRGRKAAAAAAAEVDDPALGVKITRSLHLKLAALKALARMCETDAQPAAPDGTLPKAAPATGPSTELMDRLVSELGILLCDGGASDDGSAAPLLNPEGDMNQAAVRYTAGAALLRLARNHDDRIPVATYHNLSLTLQDPMLEVRREFAKKVHRSVSRLQVKQSTRAAKYAALLFMTGADPCEYNQAAALHYLREFVQYRRLAAQRLAAANAARRGGGGTMLHECPEYMLPMAVHLLAHHPDYPAPQKSDSQDDVMEQLYKPFERMLQFGLEPLLHGDQTPADASLPVVATVLRAVKRAKDASPEPLTGRIHAMVDLALQAAQAVLARADPRRQHAAPGKVPGNVPLPSKFYAALGKEDGPPDDRDALPLGYQVEVDSLFLKPATKAPAGRSKPIAPRGRSKKRAATARADDDADSEADTAPPPKQQARTQRKLKPFELSESDQEPQLNGGQQNSDSGSGSAGPQKRAVSTKGPKPKAGRQSKQSPAKKGVKGVAKAKAKGKKAKAATAASPVERRHLRRGATTQKSLKESDDDGEDDPTPNFDDS